MRLVVDLQGAQGSSRMRGIGRYSLAFAAGLARNRGDHELVIALNGLFAESIEPLRAAFESSLPGENIVVWDAPPEFVQAGTYLERRATLELFRETALNCLEPDYVLVSSLFEGANAVTSIGRAKAKVPTAAMLYDLIPLIYGDLYLHSADVEAGYNRKLAELKQADLLLAISESSRQEAITHLAFAEAEVINISSAGSEHFSPAEIDDATRARLAERYGLARPFVMYTGGVDHRKNIAGLIGAYATLPQPERAAHQLAIVCSMTASERREIVETAAAAGLRADELVLTGYIPEDDLLACYRACKLFVFPSWHEGFGLPVLEAMMCGRAVIAGNRSSLPEVVGDERALFDPHDVQAIATRLAEVLTDDTLRTALERHGLKQAREFSWDKTARRAWAALEASHARLASA